MELTREKRTFLATLAILLCAALWFGMLGHRDLFDPDEGRYAEIPAAMVASGDWLTPRLNGLKYFEKPALQYWGTAAIYKLLGKSNATARLFTALAGFATALIAMFIAYRLYGRKTAFYTFLVTVSSMMVFTFGHVLTLDMSLTLFMLAGIGSLVIANLDRDDVKATRNWMLLGWAALALGTLTKGPVAVVLPAMTVLVYSAWQRDLELWKKLHLFKGVLLYLLITAPWFIWVSHVNPEFAKFFFIHEHFDRYTSQVHGREGPIYYFIPFLLLGVTPWLTTSVKSIFQPGFSWRPSRPGSFNPERFLWTFVVVTFCFFSLGQSKLPGYILPVFPVIAIFSGHRLALGKFGGADRWILAGLGLALLLLSLNLDNMSSQHYPLTQWIAFRPWLLSGGLVFLLAASSLFVFRRKPMSAFTVAAVLSLVSMQLVNQGMNALTASRSSRELAEAIETSSVGDAPVFSLETFPRSAAFYLGKPIRLVGNASELQMGVDSEPKLFIKNFGKFEKIWKKLPSAALIAKVDNIDEQRLAALHGTVVYRGPNQMVIIKNPSANPSRNLAIAGAP